MALWRLSRSYRSVRPIVRGDDFCGLAYSTGLQPLEKEPIEAENLAKAIPPSFGSYDIETVHAIPRDRSGTIPSNKIRKLGLVPSVLFGLPGNQLKLISLRRNEINKYIRHYRPSGIASRLFYIKIAGEDGQADQTYPALAKAIHKTATNNELENVAWMYAPMGKIVDLDVPVRITGEDISPGIKRGGYVRYVRWSITCRCRIPHIPSEIALDVSKLGLGDKVFPSDIVEDLASIGISLKEKHLGDPIIMISEGGD